MKYVFYHNDGCKLAGRGFECRKIISLVVAASTLVISSSAVAQSDRAERQFQRAVEQKQQNEAVENEKDRKLLLEMARMESNRQQTPSSSQNLPRSGGYQSYTIGEGDALAGANVATFQGGNGVILKVTGIFRPDSPTICIANCPIE